MISKPAERLLGKATSEAISPQDLDLTDHTFYTRYHCRPKWDKPGYLPSNMDELRRELDLDPLFNRIAKQGFRSEITVKNSLRSPGKYIIVCGWRRALALAFANSHGANIKEIGTYIVDQADEKLHEMARADNATQKPYSDFEQAMNVYHLFTSHLKHIEEKQRTQKIAMVLGRSYALINQILKVTGTGRNDGYRILIGCLYQKQKSLKFVRDLAIFCNAHKIQNDSEILVDVMKQSVSEDWNLKRTEAALLKSFDAGLQFCNLGRTKFTIKYEFDIPADNMTAVKNLAEIGRNLSILSEYVKNLHQVTKFYGLYKVRHENSPVTMTINGKEIAVRDVLEVENLGETAGQLKLFAKTNLAARRKGHEVSKWFLKTKGIKYDPNKIDDYIQNGLLQEALDAVDPYQNTNDPEDIDGYEREAAAMATLQE